MFRLLRLVVISFVARWLAGRFTKAKSHGLLADVVVGIVGALLGGVVFRALGIAPFNPLGDLISATAGAVILLLLFQNLRK